MVKHHLLGFEAEVDLETTQRWYAAEKGWSCKCVDCRNFRAFLRKGQLPDFVLEELAQLGIPPEKPTYVCLTNPHGDKEGYDISYRIAGNILRNVQLGDDSISPLMLPLFDWPLPGRCLHEPCPKCAPEFPEPHFDLEFWVEIPWVLDEPKSRERQDFIDEMLKCDFFGYETEVDLKATQSWYADAKPRRRLYDKAAEVRNFRAAARKRQLPDFVLEKLDQLGIPPQKATLITYVYTDEDGNDRYQFSYRLAGEILKAPKEHGTEGDCLHEPSPICPQDFPEPHFDLEFYAAVPWVLDEPKTL